ncbi:O-antigen polymerase [Halopenitus salinus]|uniref:O-antigen polymerase n=1 Tax=Halopenitus salinus TaxID=1198295 RepID=A0ABD5UZZ8_9EURY
MSIVQLALFGIFLSLSALSLAVSYIVFQDYYSPVGLLGLVWFGAISLAVLRLVPEHHTRWSLITWGIIFLSMFSFVCGFTVIYRYINVDRISADYTLEKRYLQIIIKILFILGFSSFIIMIYRFNVSVGLEYYFDHPVRARHEFRITGLYHLFLLNCFNIILIIGYMLRYGGSLAHVSILFCSLASLPFNGKRRLTIVAIVASFFVYRYVLDRYGSIYQFLLVGISVIGFFLSYAYIFNSPDAVLRPYLYLTTPFDNINYIILNEENRYYGLRTFQSVLKLLLVQDLLGLPENYSHIFYGDQYNAATYLMPLYYDFGLLGVVIGPFILGIMSALLYLYMKIRNTIISITVYAITATSIIFAFFGPFYTLVSITEFMILGIMLIVIYNTIDVYIEFVKPL